MSKDFLEILKIAPKNAPVCTGREWFGALDGPAFEPVSPVDGQRIASVGKARKADYEQVACQADAAFKVWRDVPAPRRGRAVRKMAERLRVHQDALGELRDGQVGEGGRAPG